MRLPNCWKFPQYQNLTNQIPGLLLSLNYPRHCSVNHSYEGAASETKSNDSEPRTLLSIS